MLLSFEGLSRPVELIGCDDFAHLIAALLRGWNMGEAAPSPDVSPIITIEKTEAGYACTSRWRHDPSVFRHPVTAICDFFVDLMRAYIADNPSLLCLHCAAARFRSGLVLFPSAYRAGKSVLSVHLARAGIRIFGDDVMPVSVATGEGRAAGILPRLRLPLPDDTSAGFGEFVAGHAGPNSDRYQYVNLDEKVLAPMGETAPIHGIVLLRREDGVATSIEPVEKSEVLRSAILRNFSYNMPGTEILDHLFAIVDGAACYDLNYDDGEDAVRLLIETFANAD